MSLTVNAVDLVSLFASLVFGIFLFLLVCFCPAGGVVSSGVVSCGVVS